MGFSFQRYLSLVLPNYFLIVLNYLPGYTYVPYLTQQQFRECLISSCFSIGYLTPGFFMLSCQNTGSEYPLNGGFPSPIHQAYSPPLWPAARIRFSQQNLFRTFHRGKWSTMLLRLLQPQWLGLNPNLAPYQSCDLGKLLNL